MKVTQYLDEMILQQDVAKVHIAKMVMHYLDKMIWQQDGANVHFKMAKVPG